MLLVIGVLIVVVVVFIIQSKNNPNSGSSNSGGSGPCQMKVNADVLNIRASPDANGTVVGKLDKGQTTSATKTVQNGYRQLNADQWVSAQFVTAVSGDC
jgi:uncharacterized protein YgiM (DUF1202 family)